MCFLRDVSGCSPHRRKDQVKSERRRRRRRSPTDHSNTSVVLLRRTRIGIYLSRHRGWLAGLHVDCRGNAGNDKQR
jgi:hypothetical protein